MSSKIKFGNKEKHLSKSKELQTDKCISFNFRYLSDRSYPDCKDISFFIKYLERLSKLSSISWKQAQQSDRHGFGFETLGVESIKVALPAVVTEDVKKLLVFRATGDNHAFLGLREDDVFNVIFIESQFGDIYNHS